MFPIRDHNPSQRTPFVTYALIAANILVFVYQWTLADTEMAARQFFADWALFPAAISVAHDYHGLFTSMFVHAGFLHIIGNMLFLWIFGDNLEDQMGHLRFLLFYLACGLCAGLLQVAMDPMSTTPTVGASGAISGVLGGYLLLYPRARVDILFIFIIFFRIFTVPAFLLLGVWFALQVFGEINHHGASGGVAYLAHIGGFLAGIGFALPLWLGLGGRSFWQVNLGLPPHPGASYERSIIPKVLRRK